MDSLASSLQQSLSPDPATRRSAERQLDELKAQPGFSQVVLQLAQANDANAAIRQAAALLFKNFIRNGWERVLYLAILILREKERTDSWTARTMKIPSYLSQTRIEHHSRME